MQFGKAIPASRRKGPRTLMPRGRVHRNVLGAVVDRTGRGGTTKVRSAFEAVEARYAAQGLRLTRPVSAEIVRIPIMGASTSSADGHVLHVSARAVGSEMLDGLIAHEMGHMLLTEAGHPSHDARVIERVWRTVDLPRAGQEVYRQAYNHVQDVYADDLAFRTDLGDERAYAFFTGWVRNNASTVSRSRWENVGRSVGSGFALGNLVRRRLVSKDDDLWDAARAFDRAAGLESVEGFARFFESLPTDVSSAVILERARLLETLVLDAAKGRAKPRTF